MVFKEFFLSINKKVRTRIDAWILEYDKKSEFKRTDYSLPEIKQIGRQIFIILIGLFIISQTILGYAQALGQNPAKLNPMAPVLLQEERSLQQYAKQIETTDAYVKMLKRMYGDPIHWNASLHDEYDHLFALKDEYIIKYNNLAIQYNKQRSQNIDLMSTYGYGNFAGIK